MTSAGDKKPRVEISGSLVPSLFSTWLPGGALWKIFRRPSNNCSRPAYVPRTASLRRHDFLAGRIAVPEDFDRMGTAEIEQMFGGTG